MDDEAKERIYQRNIDRLLARALLEVMREDCRISNNIGPDDRGRLEQLAYGNAEKIYFDPEDYE